MTLAIVALLVALAIVVALVPTRYFVPFGTDRTLLNEWTGTAAGGGLLAVATVAPVVPP